jgi:hypothetical protein
VLSWTRTLNMDDAHSLLARVEPGMALSAWASLCHRDLAHLSIARRRELIRILRDDLLGVDGQGRILEGLFLRFYRNAPASAQVDLLDHAWALSHPLPLVVADRLLAPAREGGSPIALDDVDRLVRGELATDRDESARKTRSVVLGALERVGAIEARGTGRNRALATARGTPHPLAFGWMLYRTARERAGTLSFEQAIGDSLAPRLTGCTREHGTAAVAWCVARGVLDRRGDELVFDEAHIAARARSQPVAPVPAGP